MTPQVFVRMQHDRTIKMRTAATFEYGAEQQFGVGLFLAKSYGIHTALIQFCSLFHY